MNTLRSRWSVIKAFVPVAFCLICAALMILAAWWKRGEAVGSPLHSALDWSIQLLVVLVTVGISVAGIASRPATCDRPAR